MCGPAIGLIGAVVNGIGAAASANAAAESHEMQAAQYEERALQQRMSGGYQARRLTERAVRMGGNQRAAFSENGLALTGSAAEVMEDTGQEFDIDVMAILWNSDAAANQSQMSAKVERHNAASARRAAPLAFLGPVLGGAARFAGSM